MAFSLNKSIEILERTPQTLKTLLQNISQDWTHQNEGAESWNAYEIVGHLIEGDKTDWIPRLDIILSNLADKSFVPFDRFAHIHDTEKKTLNELLDEFISLRKSNIIYLKSKNINAALLEKTGIHPSFGEVSLSELLATWAVHDLNHIAQISRVMAYQYKTDVGPWIEYLKILKK